MWPRNDRLQLTGIVIAALALMAAAAVTVAAPEIRCRVGLDTCDTSAHPTRSANPSASHDVLVDVATLPGEPAFSSRREPFPPTGTPHIEIGSTTITNPGHPVTIRLTGAGFHPETIADVEWNMPNGGTYEGIATYVAEDGTFDIGLYWLPVQSYGIGGNNGRWRLTVTDRVSNVSVHTSYDVTSDATTPSADQWLTRGTYRPPPTGQPTVRAVVRGRLCSHTGVRVELEVTGFPPDTSIDIDTLRTDGGRIEGQGWLTDGFGAAHNLVSYFDLDSCGHRARFVYRELVVAQTGVRASTDVVLISD